MIAFFNKHSDFNVNAYCQILRKYNLDDVANEFNAKKEKFRISTVHLNCKLSKFYRNLIR